MKREMKEKGRGITDTHPYPPFRYIKDIFWKGYSKMLAIMNK